MAGLMDAMGYGGSGSDEMEPRETKSEGGDHYKGFAKRLKMALDSGNDARAKQLLRDCIEEVLGEE
jgi:hypothetical protein